MRHQEICPEVHTLAKMAEMAINRQNRKPINKNSNEMAKGPFAKWRFRRKWRIWRKWLKWQLIDKNRQTINKNSNEMAKGPFSKWRFWRKWRI